MVQAPLGHSLGLTISGGISKISTDCSFTLFWEEKRTKGLGSNGHLKGEVKNICESCHNECY